MNRPRINTPWGEADSVTTVAPGITSYTTPSHGGFHLSQDRLNDMPPPLRNVGTFCGKPQWFEEDCDWALVVLSFPAEFTPIACRHAMDLLPFKGRNGVSVSRDWLTTTRGAQVVARSKEDA